MTKCEEVFKNAFNCSLFPTTHLTNEVPERTILFAIRLRGGNDMAVYCFILAIVAFFTGIAHHILRYEKRDMVNKGNFDRDWKFFIG